MKAKNIFRTAAVAAIGVMTMTSCNDFLTIYPTDKTVGEDFWKTKDDVDNMVTGAYRAMVNYGVQERAIIWGEFRSDEVAKLEGNTYTNNDLANIDAVNLLPTNSYNNWNDFYNVINRCNIVLHHAPEVLANDPEFQQGDYDEVRAEMLALRSLAYFYLVRTFRDVPYTTESYEGDEQEMQVAQSSPDSVLQHCIDDLNEAEQYIMRSGAYGRSDWRNKGLFTRDAVWALLSDIYLWRGSMHKSQADYEQAVHYADLVINSKDAYYTANNPNNITAGGQTDIYHLTRGSSAFYSIFVDGNSNESILEWQCDGSNVSNEALQNYYYHGSKDVTYSRLMATKIFATNDANANRENGNYVYMSQKDRRFWNNCYSVGSADVAQLSIRKMIATSMTDQYSITNSSGAHVADTKPTGIGSYDNFDRNWIVYRLTDVMLMKAEAEVQLAQSDTDRARLRQAFQLVKTVNDRSMDYSSYANGDSLTFASYNTKEALELLVLAERQRELCFEGKRWFDLVRYCYRHMDGVEPNVLMADRTAWPSLYDKMLNFVTRKYESGGDAILYKMKSEPYLYFPIREAETKVNSLLKQNPVYAEEETISKQ